MDCERDVRNRLKRSITMFPPKFVVAKDSGICFWSGGENDPDVLIDDADEDNN